MTKRPAYSSFLRHEHCLTCERHLEDTSLQLWRSFAEAKGSPLSWPVIGPLGTYVKAQLVDIYKEHPHPPAALLSDYDKHFCYLHS